MCVWGGTLIFSYIRRLGPFWGVQHFLGFQKKKKYLFGFEDFVDIFFWCHHKLDFFFGGGGGGGGAGHFYAFKGLFLRSKFGMGIFFGVAKISNIF